jgi:nucleotide-binding universal stress UspA family protein
LTPAPVLIAYDGSKHANAAIAAAARLFRDRPAVVVSAWRSLAEVVPASLVALPASVANEGRLKMDEAARDEASALAARGAELAREAGIEARAEAIEAHGAVWPAIVRAGDEHDVAALLVGSRGRSGFASAMLGSVSVGVLHHSRRPVVIVKADQAEQTPA